MLSVYGHLIWQLKHARKFKLSVNTTNVKNINVTLICINTAYEYFHALIILGEISKKN